MLLENVIHNKRQIQIKTDKYKQRYLSIVHATMFLENVIHNKRQVQIKVFINFSCNNVPRERYSQ